MQLKEVALKHGVSITPFGMEHCGYIMEEEGIEVNVTYGITMLVALRCSFCGKSILRDGGGDNWVWLDTYMGELREVGDSNLMATIGGW